MGDDSGEVSVTFPTRPDEALDAGRGKQVNGVVLRCMFATVIGLMLIVSGCTAAQSTSPAPPAAPPPSNEVGPLPEDCANPITEPEQASAALARAQPGSTMCLSGDGFTDAELEVTTPGTRQQPIRIIADGTTMRSLNVKADYVVIEGLTLKDGGWPDDGRSRTRLAIM